MLVRGDLGFSSLVFLVVAVIVFVVRRKWRYAVARREEVKKLLVLASEESARAEFEATEGYYYTATTTLLSTVSASTSASALVPLNSPLKPQHQCAVCLCPTTTRCAKCKAVRYCSGKCQIIHWRQGHKDECFSYVAVSSINDVEGGSYRQGDGKNYSDNLNTKGQQPATSVERFQEISCHKNDIGVESLADRQSTQERLKSEHHTTVSFARKSTSLGKVKRKKSNLSDEDTQSRTSSSSSRTDDGSDECSFSEPSTTSSGFWGRTIHNKKSSINELHDFAMPSSSQAANGYTSDRTTKIDCNSPIKKGFNPVSIVSDGSGLTGLGTKKSNDETKFRDADAVSDLQKSKLRESKIFPSGSAFHRASADLGRLTPKDAKPKPFGVLPSSVPERSNHVFNNKIASSHTSNSTDLCSSLSRAAVTHNDDNHRVTSCSSQVTENSSSVRNGLRSLKLKLVDQVKPSKLAQSKGLFSYEMFVKLYNWNDFELHPCGLRNCGNSCYANAVLQCLVYTPPLTAYLLEGLHSKACDKRRWCFMCEFEGLVLKAKNGTSPLSPIRILTHIENLGSNLGHGREEDAHEFLRYVIDALQSVCIKEAGTNASTSLEEETTLIGLTFGGYIRSKIQCMKCGGKSERHERMMDLTVEIEGNIGTLEEALDKFTCTEILDGENKYKCSRCKSYEKAKKKLTLLEAPNVLTIALKRFQSGKYGKLNKPIHFSEILDMAPYVSGTSDKSPIYRLYGVVVHVDTMNAAFSGHYVCYVKNVQNRWFKIDDSMVKEVDLHSVLTKGAYMLLYARCSPRAPRSIRTSLTHHHDDPRKHKTPPPFSTQPWATNNYRLSSPPHLLHRSLEEESSSSSDTSGFFSESCSCSTENSTIIEDPISGDWERDYWRTTVYVNSSDSDSSSTSSFPSPLYSRLSQLYTSRNHERSSESKVCRNLNCSCNSCRVTELGRLGGNATNPTPESGVTFRRSMVRGR